MAHSGAPDWPMGQSGSSMEVTNSGNEAGFVEHGDPTMGSYVQNSASHENHFGDMDYMTRTRAYGQPSPYSNLAFGVDSQPSFSQDIRSLGNTQVAEPSNSNGYQQPYNDGQSQNFGQFHTQELPRHYPDFARQQQQHVGANHFGANSWHQDTNSGLSYTPTSQVYPSDGSMQRMDTVLPYGQQAFYHASNNAAAPTPSPRPATVAAASWPQHNVPRPDTAPNSSQGTKPPSLRLSAPPTTAPSGDAPSIVYRKVDLGDEWKVVEGCPNLLMGKELKQRQVVTSTTGVKPHVAGDNKNGTRLLPLLPNPLPCEVLRDKVRPLVDEINIITDTIDRTKSQIKAVAVGSEEHKRYVEELEKLDKNKAKLEKEKKRITGKAGVSRMDKSRSSGKVETVGSETESITESSEEDDPQELIVQQIMATESRPTDSVKGVQYDVVRIIRHEFSADQGSASQGEKEDSWSKVIGRRVADFGKYVVDLCAEVKSLREQKTSALKGQSSQSSQLQAAIDQKYELVRIALDTALDYGDEETLRNMGQHLKLMSSLTVALSRQFSNKTYNTDLQKTILRFISQATLMDLDVFQKVKLSSQLEKHGHNLDDEGKRLVAQISKNAEERSAKNGSGKPTPSGQPKQKPVEHAKEVQVISNAKNPTPATKSTTAGPRIHPPQPTGAAAQETARKETKVYSGLVSARKANNSVGKAAPTASSMKRQRDDDIDSRVSKKVAVESPSGQSGAAKTVSASTSNSTTSQNPTSSIGQVRTRPSGSTVLNKTRSVPKPPVKKPESHSTGSSTISGLLAEIAKPAEKPKPQERPVNKISETAEERARRLRKESRRGRTVTWKSDEELVQVRFFEHDTNEDEGRASNMIRDARDNREEGQMLKKQQQMQRNMQDGDDEDDGNPAETPIHPWSESQAIDYSVLDASKREKTYTTRGGILEANSEQKHVMEEYENRELMTIYTTLSEIPDSPRSPSKNTAEPFVPLRHSLLPSGIPQTQEIQQRWSEIRQFGATAASRSALRRVQGASNPGTTSVLGYGSAGPKAVPSQVPTTAIKMTQAERDASVLSLLQSARARNYVDPNPHDPANPRTVQPPKTGDQKVLKAFSILQSAVDQYRHVPTTSAVKPRSSTEDQARKAAENIPGQYNAPPFSHLSTQAQTLQQALAYPQLTPQVPQVPEQYAAILQQVQALQNSQAAQTTIAPQPAPPQTDFNLSALLATLGQSSAQPAQVTAQDPNHAAWQLWAQSQTQPYGTQSQSQPQASSYPAYAQQYDGITGDESSYGTQRQNYNSQEQHQRDSGGDRGNRKDSNKEYKQDFNRGAKDHKGINRALIGTKPCSFWAKGQCAKGDNCTFRHDPNDLK